MLSSVTAISKQLSIIEMLTSHLPSRQTVAAEEVVPPSRTVTFAQDIAEPRQVSRTATFADAAAPPLNRRVTYIPSRLGKPNESSICYTANPLKLFWYDIKLRLSKILATASITMPWRIGSKADSFDELYPNMQNIISLMLHTILIFTQAFFLISTPFCAFVPTVFFLGWVGIFFAVNSAACYILNGDKLKVYPSVEVDREGKHSDEYWIFLNGVSVGRDWLQSNIDRLSLTFGRPVTGVHNPTYGILFDLIQCLIQRNFAYSTQEVREAYACVKEALLDTRIKKVVFILHSQGGIEGGLILDWLFAEVSRTALHHLEVYTFGNAASHFNNPDWCSLASQHTSVAEKSSLGKSVVNNAHTKVIRHIEHYANCGDFVAQIGVMNYSRVSNSFMGRLFMSPNNGHLLNQHYLHYMFPLDEDRRCTAEENEFMEMDVRLNRHDVAEHESVGAALDNGEEENMAFVGDLNSSVSPVVLCTGSGTGGRLKVKDFSRLWQYRNGGSPPDDENEGRGCL